MITLSKLERDSKPRVTILRSCGLLLLALSLTISSIVFLSHGPTANAESNETLANTYAPVLHFTKGEKFYPTRVEYIISNSTLIDHTTGQTIDPVPTAASLGSHTSSDLYLNNMLATQDAIASDYATEAATNGYYVYAHAVNTGTQTIIQYWLFYAFNNGPLNDHQGDIEVVEIFLDSTTDTPKTALYSQHFAGQSAGWGDVEKVDNHPVVYVAQGSHANYFRPYQGKIGLENDAVGNDGITINPADLRIVMLGEHNSHPPEQGWLDYGGRWGYWGTQEEVALGRAGPYGPVFNQDGTRWAQPQAYLDTTFGVGNLYFMVAWLVANFLLLFIIYIVARAGWKTFGIVKLRRKSGLLVKKFFKSRGGPSLMMGVAAIIITLIALFLPWYTINASSESGPLAGQGGVTLMTINGISGLQVNMFLGSGESSSGFSNLFSMQMPFMIVILAGLVLLILDVIGIRSGKSLGNKLVIGAITSLLPFILIFVFIMMLPTFLPWAKALVPGQDLPPQVETMMRSIAANAVYGANTQSFPIVGQTTVNWGFGIGAYLFLVAAIIRIVAGFIMRTTPELQPQTPPAAPPPTPQTQPASPLPSPPPPSKE